MKQWYADLHVHSRFAYACARDLTAITLAAAAAFRGLRLIGTGDFTHPVWAAELRELLIPAGGDLFRLRPDLILPHIPRMGDVHFVISTEVSTIFRREGRVHKVHHLIFVPTWEVASRLSDKLRVIGRLDADGRPVLKLDARDLLEMVLEAGEGSFLVPAHVWTPWFSALGARGGFSSLSACYGDLTPHIFAVETGLSADPAMMRRCSELDGRRLLSSSDAHSAPSLGREATVFTGDLSFEGLRLALGTGDGYGGTLEMYPEEGKYHYDGHRLCGVVLAPRESLALEGRCPICHKRLTEGVAGRVEVLADRPPEDAPRLENSRHILALPQVIGQVAGSGPASRGVQHLLSKLVTHVAPELEMLTTVPMEEIHPHHENLAEAISRLRRGEVEVSPGYDGVYGRVKVWG